MNLQGKRTPSELASILYHDVFDYPLTKRQLVKWGVSKKQLGRFSGRVEIDYKDGYFFLKGRERIVRMRLLRERVSGEKLRQAERSAKILALIPQVKMVGVSGSLAMRNSKRDSDIDFIIITSKGVLWVVRLLSYLLLTIFRIPIRNPGRKDQKDRLCLNIWLDRTSLVWDKNDRNLYTAHEIAQIVPLVNKEGAFEEFILSIRWVRDYWPDFSKRLDEKLVLERGRKGIEVWLNRFISLMIEPFVQKVQYWYMKDRITHEVVRKERAVFHPIDLGETVLSEFNKRLGE
jgi:predicted nucleotidyltransferase